MLVQNEIEILEESPSKHADASQLITLLSRNQEITCMLLNSKKNLEVFHLRSRMNGIWKCIVIKINFMKEID